MRAFPKIHIFLTIIFICFSAKSFAQIKNEILFKKVASQLNLKEKDIALNLVADKILPFETDKTAFVIPVYEGEPDDEQGDFNIFVLIVENSTGKILNKFYKKNALVSDAIYISGIEIDTGLNKLNEKTRAFGFRVNYYNRSGPNPYGRTDLFLYIKDGNTLREILNDYPMQIGTTDWDMKCAGKSNDTNSTIDIGKEQNHNFSDLIVKDKIVTTISKGTKDKCIEKSTAKTSISKLKFNGLKYMLK